MKLRIFCIFSISLLLSSSLFGQVVKYWPKRIFPSLTIENALWIGTPKGLYRYDIENEAWAIFGTHNGLPDNNIQFLQYDGEFLWIITPKGLSAGDIRLNKWLNYSTENGLPNGMISSIAFQEDYVWIGTYGGAARFDKLIEEWEIFTIRTGLPDSVVHDVVVEDDLVYFATRKGLAEYHVQFEKWRYYSIEDGLVSNNIQFIYATSEFLWLFTDQGISRFHKNLKTMISFTISSLQSSQIQDLQQDGDQFWLSTKSGVLTYDPASQIWRPFLESHRLPSQNAQATAVIQNNRYFLTDAGTVIRNQETGMWQTLDKSIGLSQNVFNAIAEMNGFVFLLDYDVINYFKPAENRWFVLPITEIQGGEIQTSRRMSFDRQKGSMIQFSPRHILSFSGSQIYFRQDWLYNIRYHEDWKSSSRSIRKNDLKTQLTLGSDRTLNGFYNDRDFSQKQYGVRYKGKKGDLVQEMNWGDVRDDQSRSDLSSSVNIFGGSMRMEAGPKTKQYKRSLFFASGFTGHQTSGTEIEYFTGDIQSDTLSVRDIDFLKNVYFALDTSQLQQKIDPRSEQIFLDDGNPLTNTANTMCNLSVANQAGDFDRLIPVQDYEIDYLNGFVHIFKPVSFEAALVFSATADNIPFERILKKPMEKGLLLENRYMLLGSILPHSFQMEILDAFGLSYTLSFFGLDENNDGFVDPEFINFETGLLTFPQARPFPPSVYDTDPDSHFRIRLSFQTPVSIIQLRHSHLIRGSEEVRVDGLLFQPGEDYVLDYTRGTLLIIKEGAVGADSEIEVQYEFYRDTKDGYHRLTAGTGPTDRVMGELSAFEFEKSDSTATHRVRGYNITSEFKTTFQGADIKFSPQAAYSRSSDDQGKGFHLRTDLSTQSVRLFSILEKYDTGFQSLVDRQFRLGPVSESMILGGRFFPMAYTDIQLYWSDQRTHEALTGDARQQDLSGQVLINAQNLPVFSLYLRHRDSDINQLPESKKTIKADVEYQFPKTILDFFRLQSLRLYGVWRKSWEHGERYQFQNIRTFYKKAYENRYFRWELSPVRLVQFNGYYRNIQTNGQKPFANDLTLYAKKEKWFLDATVDRVQGTNLNLHFESEANTTLPFSERPGRNLTLYRIFQSQIRIFPGRWISLLQPFTFQINYQPSWSGSLRHISSSLNWYETFWQFPASETLIRSDENQTIQFRTEYRPNAKLSIYSGIDLSRLNLQRLSSRQKINRYELYEKLEYRLGLSSLLVVQYIRNWEEKAYATHWINENAFMQFETRWNQYLQSKIYLSYGWRENQTAFVSDWNRYLTPRVALTYRIYQKGSRLLRAEFRDDISWTTSETQMPTYGFQYNTLSNALAFDIYPASVLVLRLRWILSSTQYVKSNDYMINHRVEFRLVAQL